MRHGTRRLGQLGGASRPHDEGTFRYLLGLEHEDGLLAGAVLTELGEGCPSDTQKLLSDKVIARGLLESLPPDLAGRLQIHVRQHSTLGAQY